MIVGQYGSWVVVVSFNIWVIIVLFACYFIISEHPDRERKKLQRPKFLAKTYIVLWESFQLFLYFLSFLCLYKNIGFNIGLTPQIIIRLNHKHGWLLTCLSEDINIIMTSSCTFTFVRPLKLTRRLLSDL